MEFFFRKGNDATFDDLCSIARNVVNMSLQTEGKPVLTDEQMEYVRAETYRIYGLYPYQKARLFVMGMGITSKFFGDSRLALDNILWLKKADSDEEDLPFSVSNDAIAYEAELSNSGYLILENRTVLSDFREIKKVWFCLYPAGKDDNGAMKYICEIKIYTFSDQLIHYPMREDESDYYLDILNKKLEEITALRET